jgi:hypothetical protein
MHSSVIVSRSNTTEVGQPGWFFGWRGRDGDRSGRNLLTGASAQAACGSLDREGRFAFYLGVVGLGDLELLGSGFAEGDPAKERVRPVIGRRERV